MSWPIGAVSSSMEQRHSVAPNRNPIRQVVLEERYLKRNPHLAFSDVMQEVSPFGQDAKVFPLSPDTTAAGYLAKLMGKPHAGTMTSACGTHIHRGTGLSPAHYGPLKQGFTTNLDFVFDTDEATVRSAHSSPHHARSSGVANVHVDVE